MRIRIQHLLALLSIVLVSCDQLGEVVPGNVNIGKDNTILSTGNFVKGTGNVVVPLDSTFDPFKDDPFFANTNVAPLFDPQTPTTVVTPVKYIHVLPSMTPLPNQNIGPIPAVAALNDHIVAAPVSAVYPKTSSTSSTASENQSKKGGMTLTYTLLIAVATIVLMM